jgi:hypothetical protein
VVKGGVWYVKPVAAFAIADDHCFPSRTSFEYVSDVFAVPILGVSQDGALAHRPISVEKIFPKPLKKLVPGRTESMNLQEPVHIAASRRVGDKTFINQLLGLVTSYSPGLMKLMASAGSQLKAARAGVNLQFMFRVFFEPGVERVIVASIRCHGVSSFQRPDLPGSSRLWDGLLWQTIQPTGLLRC